MVRSMVRPQEHGTWSGPWYVVRSVVRGPERGTWSTVRGLDYGTWSGATETQRSPRLGEPEVCFLRCLGAVLRAQLHVDEGEGGGGWWDGGPLR